jgi:hypothetical protein
MTARPRSILVMNRNYRNAIFVALGTVTILAGLWLVGDPVPLQQRILASLIGVLSVIPLIVFYLDRQAPIVPMMAANSLFYFVAFAYTGFYFSHDAGVLNKTTERSWILGLELGIVGLVAQMFGYYITKATFGRPKPIRVISNLSPERIRFLAWLLLTIRFLLVVIPGTAEIPTLGQFAKLIPFISVGLLIMVSMTNRLGWFERILLYVVVIPVELIFRLNSGAVYEPLLLVIFIFFARWIITRRINWVIILAGMTIFTVFNPIKFQYRDVVWYSSAGKEMSAPDKLSLFMSLAVDYWFSGNVASDEVATNLRSRLNHLALAAIVTEATPDYVPYWNGETLELGLVAFIPRFLWPNKPVVTFGNHFGIRYGMLDVTDTSTTINLTWAIEFYANYGYIAVVIGMALIGVAFAWLERWFATPGTSLVDVIIPFSTTFTLVYPESNIVMSWGGVISSTLLFYFLAWTLEKKS